MFDGCAAWCSIWYMFRMFDTPYLPECKCNEADLFSAQTLYTPRTFWSNFMTTGPYIDSDRRIIRRCSIDVWHEHTPVNLRQLLEKYKRWRATRINCLLSSDFGSVRCTWIFMWWFAPMAHCQLQRLRYLLLLGWNRLLIGRSHMFVRLKPLCLIDWNHMLKPYVSRWKPLCWLHINIASPTVEIDKLDLLADHS